MWKILTAQIREEIYNSLACYGLFLKEQKGCLKGTRGTDDLLYRDENILKVKTRQKNIAMSGFDNKKANDIVLQTWIIEYLKMYKTSNK